jgi:hypothetical protein
VLGKSVQHIVLTASYTLAHLAVLDGLLWPIGSALTLANFQRALLYFVPRFMIVQLAGNSSALAVAVTESAANATLVEKVSFFCDSVYFSCANLHQWWRCVRLTEEKHQVFGYI